VANWLLCGRYHEGSWKPPQQFYGVDGAQNGPNGWTNAVEEMRTMRCNLKRSGKAQVAVLPKNRVPPRSYGGAHHNFQPGNASIDDDDSGVPCLKRSAVQKKPNHMMESIEATLVELRDQERSIVSRKRHDVDGENAPQKLEDERWYESGGPEFNEQMGIYMKSLNSSKKWSDKDEHQLQNALQKTGLDLSRKQADVMKRPNTKTPSRSKRR